MLIVRTIIELRAIVNEWRQEGLKVGVVPTMGSLHAGHLSLVRESRCRSDKTIATLFVNPTQFAPGEDFDTYPRDEQKDCDLLIREKTDLLYAPAVEVMYPEGNNTAITVGKIGTLLEGEFRPHFFGGVATIVTKLLMQCQPDVAVFGEKDFQQLCVIRQLIRDLNIPVEIIGSPTIREEDGLAMSSRNRYLTPEQRQIATALPRMLKSAADQYTHGADLHKCEETARKGVLDAGFDSVDYICIRDAETLQHVTDRLRPARILGAATLGKTRLIDNLSV